jgi:hypothetical protein
MPSRPRSALASNLGQSMVETVIFLPVLVVIFLGMFYMKGLINTKMRAIEAARYVTWENTWIPREGIPASDSHPKDVIADGRPRGQKDNATLRNELIQVGLGAYLCTECPDQGVQGTKRKESLNDYFNRVQPGSLPMIVGIPAVVSQLFGNNAGFGDGSTSQFSSNPDNPPGSSGGSSSGSGPLSGLDTGNGLNDLLNTIGGAAFTVYGHMGHQTKWGTESDESVITSQVVYKYNAGGTTVFVPRFIAEKSSILSHPFNIKRSDDQEEHHRLAGDGKSCTDVDDLGHIFDLWIFPSGEPDALRFGKCPFAAISTIANFLGSLNPFSPSVPLRIPNGTLKEYPEMDLPASAGNGGTGNPGGSGLGGGNNQPPHS